IEDLIGKKGKGQMSMAEIDVNIVKDYAAEDADITYLLKKIINEKLEEDQVTDVFQKIEMPLVSVLAEIEYNGVFVDTDFLNEYSVILDDLAQKSEREIYSKAGVAFNIASPKQVGEVLFDKLMIPYRWTRTSGGQYSTSEEKL
ncbi:DNA polymerase, partial [Arthrospira platensis SPKY1]|nr:DNA polymerase [Arthrospira platensis SPKY1]